MPSLVKAQKKAAKKKAAAHDGDHHHKHPREKDLRRAFEHQGRVEVLQRSLESASADAVGVLKQLAQAELENDGSKDAADLLRAAEHLSFALLAARGKGAGKVSAGLKDTITKHFDELMRKADEHWVEDKQSRNGMAVIYQGASRGASKAFKAGDYYQALEFARTAEALAHIKKHKAPRLKSPEPLRLKGA